MRETVRARNAYIIYAVTEGNDTVLDDPVTVQCTHTLTRVGGEYTGGEYTCTVTNNGPFSDSASITVPGIISWLKAV